MRASVSPGQVTFGFEIEVGSVNNIWHEEFDWRKIKKGTDDRIKEGGFRLVASSPDEADASGTSSLARVDGQVVTLLMWC